MSAYHTSVLLHEAIHSLFVRPGEWYIDATLGGGGHTQEILKKGGRVLGIDVDKDALEYVEESLQAEVKKKQLLVARGNFKDIGTIAREHGFDEVAGILFDFGVSSHQFDTAERGFSFQKEGNLDMRMDDSLGVQAADLIAALSRKELYELFTKFGEETRAKPIADAIARAREIKPIKTTRELEQIVFKAVGGRREKINPATKVFQALRIAINDELTVIEKALPQALTLVKNGGRMVVITFHSLEDRIVKHAFEAFENQSMGKIITRKPIVPSEREIIMNKRSRSAKLRVFEKIT